MFQFVVNKTEKSVEFTKGIVFMHKKICRFEIIDGVKYVYCIKHAYNFSLKEQEGFAAILWRLRQCVSCTYWCTHNFNSYASCSRYRVNCQSVFIFSWSCAQNVNEIFGKIKETFASDTVMEDLIVCGAICLKFMKVKLRWLWYFV